MKKILALGIVITIMVVFAVFSFHNIKSTETEGQTTIEDVSAFGSKDVTYDAPNEWVVNTSPAYIQFFPPSWSPEQDYRVGEKIEISFQETDETNEDLTTEGEQDLRTNIKTIERDNFVWVYSDSLWAYNPEYPDVYHSHTYTTIQNGKQISFNVYGVTEVIYLPILDSIAIK